MLTPKQKKFCDYYIISGNATESAVKAGYSKKNAYSMGHENLQKPKLIEYIRKKELPNEENRIADMVEVQEFWTEIMRDEIVRMDERLRASELIARSNGAFLDRIEQSGDLTLKVEWVDEN